MYSCGNEYDKKNVSHSVKNNTLPYQPINLGRDLHLRFEKYNMDHGLVNNTIFDIDADMDGNIWICTESGISVYNGIDFKTLPKREKSPYDIGAVQVLELDKNGDAWFFEQGQGLIHFDVSLQKYTIYKDSVIGIGFNLLPSKMYIYDDVIYFSEPFGRFDRVTNLFSIIDPECTASCKHPNNDVLFTVSRGGQTGINIIKYEIENSKIKVQQEKAITTTSMNNGFYNDMTCDKNGHIYFGTQVGIFSIYNSNNGQFQEIRPDITLNKKYSLGGTIKNLYYDSLEHCVWMTGYCHLLRYDCSSEARDKYRFIRYSPDSRDLHSISEQYCSKVLRDTYGNLWVGSQNSGLNVNNYSQRQFKVFKSLYGDSTTILENEVTACAFDEKGLLCVGTKNKGISILTEIETGNFKLYSQKRYYGQDRGNLNAISSISYNTSSKKFYISSWGNYIFEFDQKSNVYQPLDIKNLTSEELRGNIPDYFIIMSKVGSDGKIFFGDWDGWIDIYDPMSNKFLLTKIEETECTNKLENTLTRAIYISSDSFLYVSYDAPANLQRIKLNESTFEGCIENNKYIFGTSKPFEKFNLSKSNSSEGIHGQITIINEENKDILWIGTTSGLYKYKIKDKKASKFGKKEGFKSDYIQSMEWHDKHLWIGTQNGLYCFDTGNEKILSSWNKQNGMPDNHFNLNASTKFNDSLYAFGTKNGIVLFEPKKLIDNHQKVELKGLMINGVNVIIKNSFSSNEKNLTFQFGTDDVANTSKLKYQYKLSGIDVDWQTTDMKPVANYTNLNSGSYQFMYKKLSQDSDDEPMLFTFTIQNPWYKTWWFISLVFMGVSGVIYLLIKRRQKIEADKEIERSKMIKYLQIQTLQSQINPHFIFNVLGTMQNQILNKDPEQANKHLINLSKLIRRFLDSSVSSNISSSTALTTSEITLEEELELLHMYIQFEQLQREDKFEYDIQVSDNISKENEYLPPLIIQPYVENAIKHGLLYKETKGRLIINFSKLGEVLICKVIDDGVGREAAHQFQKESKKIYVSRGKKLVEDRVKILNEVGYHIKIDTSDNAYGGTTVTLSIS